MIDIKNKEQIEIMQTGGKMLADTLWEVIGAVKPGVTEEDLDKLAEKLIREKGGEPGFMKVPDYHHTICASTNSVIVHGIPGKRVLKEGDIIGIDCGVYYKGYHTDMSETVGVGKIDNEVRKFLDVGRYALDEAIKQAVIGNRIGHISQTIQRIVEKENKYSVLRSLIGHGVGKELHEDPEVPGYIYGKIDETPLLKEGMTIAIEVIYNMGKKDAMLEPDGWTIVTADGSLSGVFERSIAITANGPLVLTPSLK